MDKNKLLTYIFGGLFLMSSCEKIAEAPIYDSNLANADYWSEEPKILSAGVGFADILGVDVEINRENAITAGAAWLDDMNCNEDDANLFTTLVRKSGIESTFRGKVNANEFKEGTIGLDGLPVVFSWPVLTDKVHPEDFRFTLNTGEVVTPQLAGMTPNFEYNERNVIVVLGEFANRLPSTDPNSRFPIKCEIVDDGSPIMLVGPNKQIVSAVGLTWETTSSPYDPNNGPRLVGAKLNYCGDAAIGEGLGGGSVEVGSNRYPNDEFALYGAGDFRLRMLTTGGFSPDGVRGVKPTDFEKYFRIHANGSSGTVIIDKVGQDFDVQGGKLRVIGLSDLGQSQNSYDECYTEDKDNYIDIILVGDEEAARNITFLEIPSLAGGYSAFYNPGGPGTTPNPGTSYSSPGPADLEPVIIALDDPMRVSYDAYRYK